MKDYMETRVKEVANYIIETKTTVRGAAEHFMVSKSTIHKDVTQRLPEVSPALVPQVRDVLNVNLEERHIRGGEMTKLNFSGTKKPKNVV